MKRILTLFSAIIICMLFPACSHSHSKAQIAATTLPVYEFTSLLCQGTDLEVVRLVTENISCLHDYTLQTEQMRAIENAEIVVISGAGLETFLEDVLPSSDKIIDASADINLLCHDGAGEHSQAHSHEHDPHIWLSPDNAKTMAANICDGLSLKYPEFASVFADNLLTLESKMDELAQYAALQLQTLSCRKLITFHDGFSYMADAFDLQIVHAIEEESGSEASASVLIALIQTVSEHELHAVFTECNGSTSAARIVAAETGAEIYQLDMAMAGNSYFDAMHRNIDTLKEALG